jgi:hypothetical protein
MSKGTPFLQIIHYSDIHLAQSGYLKTRWQLGRAYPTLSLHLKQGWAGARRAVLNEFIHVIRGLTANDKEWKGRPTWLVDTGDGTTFGDSQSLLEWEGWSKKFLKAAGNGARQMRVYGNHDGWPGTFPLFAPARMTHQRDMLRKRFFTETWPEPPWTMPIPGTSGQVELCAANTVDHELLPNTLALGVAARDRHWKKFQTIPLDTPADDLAQQAKVHAAPPCAGNLRVTAMHYPVADAATAGSPHFQKVMTNRRQFSEDLRSHSEVQPLVAHLLLAGHTHMPYPPLGSLPRSATAAQHSPLVGGQCQIVSGSLSQDILPGASIPPGTSWADTLALQNPYQCTLLRFYNDASDPEEVRMERTIIGADDSGIFSLLPIAPKSNTTSETMTFRI